VRRSAILGAGLGALLLILTPAAGAQPNPLLSGRQALELYRRSVQLMESTATAIPGLARAGAPVAENTRAAVVNLEKASGQPAALTYTLLVNLKAYLALADSVPKPYPFPEEAGKQFAELHQAIIRIESHFEALLGQKDTQLRGADRDNLRRYAEANARLGPPEAARPRVVFLGDSITDGWRLNEYFPERDFVNRGISGQITGEILGRMNADVVDLKPADGVWPAPSYARGVPLTTIQNNYHDYGLAEAGHINHLRLAAGSITTGTRIRNTSRPRAGRRPPSHR
jgi:hypothetical protein